MDFQSWSRAEIKDRFRQISIRGRGAYILVCLESLLKQLNILHDLDSLLDRLWEQVETMDVVSWHDRVLDIFPEYPHDLKEHIKTEVSNELLNDIHSILETALELGSPDIEMREGEDNPETLLLVSEVIERLLKHEVQCPALEPFKRSPYDECNGHGRAVSPDFFRDHLK